MLLRAVVCVHLLNQKPLAVRKMTQTYHQSNRGPETKAAARSLARLALGVGELVGVHLSFAIGGVICGGVGVN